MDKYDTSQLTEFPRFESESSQSGVSTFFNKLWKFPLFTPSENTDNGPNKSSEEENRTSAESEQQNKDQYEERKAETGTYAVEMEGRSLPNVLRRISSLVALGSGGGTRYADTELARYWMPDDISRECYECATRFTALRRRHHCRVCGQIFCSRCCSQRVPGHIFGCSGGLRVCNYCCNVVLSYLKENDHTGQISPDLRTLQESLQVKFPNNKELSSKSRDNFVFSHDQDERCDVRTSQKETLHDVFRQLSYALPTQQHRYRLVSYNGVWRGCDILQWILDNTHYKTRSQASTICQSLLTTGYMECVTELPHFADYALYRPLVVAGDGDDDDDVDDEQSEVQSRLVESVSSYCLDLNLGERSARLIKTSKAEKKSSSSDEEAPVIEQNEGVEERPACSALSNLGAEHLRQLLGQRLALQALSPNWLPVLLPLCQSAAANVVLEPHNNDIDIRNYVQVKKVPGGSPRDSTLINGVVLTKNVAHRGMPQQISKARILLLDCSIAYQRVEGKLTSLEPVLMQESEYLSRCAARIAHLRAHVVLVSGACGRHVQGALAAARTALALRVRARTLRRAARCAAADLLTSLDARIGTPTLGTCDNFYVKNYGSKTLMVLEGCAKPNLGCCILLRGASLQELIRVKKVVKFMLLACYNWKLEKAFLTDIDAVLPEPGMTFDDEIGDENDDEKSIRENDDKKSIRSIDKMDDKLNSVKEEDDIFNDRSDDPDLFDSNAKCKLDNTDKNLSIGELDGNSDNDKFNFESNKESQATDEQKDEANRESSESHVSNNEKAFNSDGNSQVDSIQRKTTHMSSDEVFKSKDKSLAEDDPLQRPKYTRKTENLSCGVPIRDFSDPLRSVDDDVFLSKEDTTFKADAQNERWCTDDVILSISPNVIIPAPYLETEAGRKCPLRAYFPSPLLPPPALVRVPPVTRTSTVQVDTERHEYHPFVSMAIKSTADDPKFKAELASFRALGCRLNKDKHKPSCSLYAPSVIRKAPVEADPGPDPDEQVAPYSPDNHQRLHLLLYSFSNKSPNVPDFCVNPWTVTMEMYGRHDISLGAFLDKYCFNGEYKCTSNNCHVPMNQHVRRFVHGDVCITITCNTIGHSNVDKVKEEQTKQVTFWSRCEQCGSTSRARRLSRASLSLSLAAYLAVRVRCARALHACACAPRPAAGHAHAHAHAFQSLLTTACFRFSKISTYDIVFPPHMISINYDTKQMREQLIAELNELMLKGHETFSSCVGGVGGGGVGGGEAEKEASVFKHHTENLHVALTQQALQDADTDLVRSLWSISDGIILGEKMLRDVQDKWANTTSKNKPQNDTPVEEKPELDDYSTELGAGENLGTTYAFPTSDNSSKDSDKEHTGTEDDEEKGDKKTVKQILSQLLSNNQPANQTGMIFSGGLIPVVVRATQTGAVFAAALLSAGYRRAATHFHNTQPEPEESDNTSNKDKSDGDKSKATKSNEHIEVSLKDGLICRVYYAAQFQALRHAIIAPREKDFECCCDNDKKLCSIEEAFIRSLADCVPWAARGGKSGSTFCKTKDDRYVLKEMTKPEWQQFLEFAPHYFNYVNNCRLNNTPSLLARILGVYSVGGVGGAGAGSGVLVMENVWYSAAPQHHRFDLKGSARHRLAPAHRLLMDDNLLHLRWERALYVRSHAARVLFAALERDTSFLSAHLVMDYSLLLALGEHSLVLGLIDYIRTFTWDKKLEHLVKKNLGSGQPTVVSPDQYRSRFLAAAGKYFLACPEHWDHLYHLLPAGNEA